MDPDNITARGVDTLLGHDAAERALLDSWASGRLHHAWMFTGPRGIGKATLAMRFARFLLAEGNRDAAETDDGLFGDALTPSRPMPDSLHVSPENPIARRIAAGGHGDIRVMTRGTDPKTGRERNEIVVGDVRAVNDFFSMTSSEGGWRIAIVDSADELNRNAANALLKTLEEPPARSILMLVAHRPGLVLPTVRSRCRRLSLMPLTDADVIDVITRPHPDLAPADARILAALSDGSPGRALELVEADGVTLYRRLLSLMADLPDLSPHDVLALADAIGARGKEAAFNAFAALLSDLLTRVVRFGAEGDERVPGEGEALARISGMTGLDRWIEVWEKSNNLIRQGNALNLDRRQVAVTILNNLAGAVRGVPA